MLKKQSGNINQIRKANHVKLNRKTREILDGLLLGDGTLSTKRQNISALYEQGDKNLSYLVWLSRLLQGCGIKQSGQIYRMKKVVNKAYKLKTLTYFELGEIRQRWYPNNKKAIPRNFRITPTSLKFWYIGDGNFSDSPLIDSSIFSMYALQAISKQFRYIGFRHTLRQFKDRIRLRISRHSQERFIHYICSDDIGFPGAYRYKIIRRKYVFKKKPW